MPAFPEPPVIPSGHEIYDTLMGKIEPELVSAVIPTLKEKYRNETPTESGARKDRYNKAFKKYYEELKKYIADLDSKVREYHRASMKSIEQMSRTGDTQKLSSLEDALNSL